jgi:glycosyltransferase involved in cell wall biosynthesis
MSKKLSILIVSLVSRKTMLDSITRFLKAQVTADVEVLVSIDNGERSIGAKRNELLKSATGEYVAFVDDDDYLSPFYVKNIIEAIKDKPDCVGITGVILLKKEGPRIFKHSLQYKHWFEENEVYYRCPNHLNPIKREIALSAMFPDMSNQEDRVYSSNLLGKLKTETNIETPLYYYIPSSES